MRIYVNDTPRELASSFTLDDLALDLGLLGRRGIAIAVNDAVVPRSIWSSHALAPDDRVLVIQATQGG